jgi:uncharacterized FlgJ-related protein
MNEWSLCRKAACGIAVILLLAGTASQAQEVVVFSGLGDVMDWLKSENWWGEENREKEIFYRFMLPLIVHANGMVMERRSRLLWISEALRSGEDIPQADMDALREGAVLLRIMDSDAASELTQDSNELQKVIDEALYKLDIIPAGLALGQAAYESGYGTSRFAVQGNALFGQWTYGGKGLVPEQQRKNLGDHRIAAFDWPFDSVRGYFINLMSHPAYEEFRRLRAQLREQGQPLTSMALADGLIRYSERGQEYVDTLKGIIRVNGLDIADEAVFRDEPMRFIVGAEDAEAAVKLRQEIERLRESGELGQIIARMRLE